MAKVRVYELAKKIGIPSKELVKFLDELGADIKNHMSTIDDEIARMVYEHFVSDDEDAGEGEKKAKPKRKPAGKKETKDAALAEEKEKRSGRGQKARKTKEQHRGLRRASRRTQKQAAKPSKEIELGSEITVGDLASRLSVPPAQVIKTLMGMGVMAAVTQAVDEDTAAAVAKKLGYSVKVRKQDEPKGAKSEELIRDEAPEELELRPPVVTIMGHVDHGKTTLLDAIRSTKVVAEEAGGITQHIGAYQVKVEGKKITFIDTPGHEAFTAMRSRGAQITDIAILVVAADDGVMPQTVEAINHAKAAEVPIIVAINKIDRPGANPDRIYQQLVEHELVPEAWGGDTICVPISALKKEGLDELLEMILLVAELRELKANPNRPAQGTIIEAELDKGRGPVATVLVQNGTLRVGDAVVAGLVPGKVRALVDHTGKRVEEAGPSEPVELLGLADVPQAGDVLTVFPDEKEARSFADEKQMKLREQELKRKTRLSLRDLHSQMQEGIKDLNIVVKADVQGSVEAVSQALEKLSTDEVRVNVIHGAVGGITETDVNLAAASNAIIIGFNVRPESTARKAAEKENVDMNMYRVIYEAMNDVKAAMSGLLEPEYREKVLGQAEVRATFKVPGAGTVAGCYVREGKIARSAQIRVLRDNIIVHEGRISSLKRFKDDVREVAQGYECGIGIENYNDIKEGDVFECFIMEEIARSIS